MEGEGEECSEAVRGLSDSMGRVTQGQSPMDTWVDPALERWVEARVPRVGDR
jgi:hypothetical protein